MQVSGCCLFRPSFLELCKVLGTFTQCIVVACQLFLLLLGWLLVKAGNMPTLCVCWRAGVPLSAPVAGIAMGLILEPDGSYVVLSDILGAEDALGDMDFKVGATDRWLGCIGLIFQGCEGDQLKLGFQPVHGAIEIICL